MPLSAAATTPDALISAFTSRYANTKTRHQYEAELSALFADTGAATLGT